jgi:hypothetical protein
MNNMQQMTMLLSALATQLPVFVVCIVASVVVLVRWKEGARGSIWALLGFGLALTLCIVVPVVQTSVQHWIMESGDAARRASVFTGLSILWSLLRAATYALLLVAVFAGRSMSPRDSHGAAGS